MQKKESFEVKTPITKKKRGVYQQRLHEQENANVEEEMIEGEQNAFQQDLEDEYGILLSGT